MTCSDDLHTPFGECGLEVTAGICRGAQGSPRGRTSLGSSVPRSPHANDREEGTLTQINSPSQFGPWLGRAISLEIGNSVFISSALGRPASYRGSGAWGRGHVPRTCVPSCWGNVGSP